MYRKVNGIILLLALFLCIAGCGGEEYVTESEIENNSELQQESDGYTFTYEDALGNRIEFSEAEQKEIADGSKKVAVLNGSYAEIWSLAGGKLSIVTEDAYEEGREIAVDDDTVNIGAMKNPNLEMLLALDAKIAILSADIEGHTAIHDKLEDMGIKTVYHSVETFDDYLKVLKFYTELTGRGDCYEEYGASIAESIDSQIARQDDSHPAVLFLRAYTGGVKAKGSDSMTGLMLKELGCINIADGEERFTDDLSIEVILEKNPDYIFVTVMGNDEEAGLESVKTLLEGNPAWNDLSAVQNNRYYVLQKNMFHNKPNQRWGESYRILADILYPEQETP